MKKSKNEKVVSFFHLVFPTLRGNEKVELLSPLLFSHLVSFWRSSENPGNDTMETQKQHQSESFSFHLVSGGAKLVEQRPVFFSLSLFFAASQRPNEKVFFRFYFFI